jgi:23S rRNA G2445 N2-methylase RlmL
MTRSRSTALPACYALVVPGLEAIAAEEIEGELGGEIKRSGQGIVVFRVDPIDVRVLALRTVEDVFVLAWGTDQLSYRAADLERMRRWTAGADWPTLLRIHHAIRPRPRGKPTYWLVAQMEGHHGYLRRDVRRALAEGLADKLPASWRPAEENASVEVWLSIQGATAVCGLRLSDRTMRHRTYKLEHRPASLRPTVAAAMVRLAELQPRHVVLDPLCGAGTLLAERLAVSAASRQGCTAVWGGDIDFGAVRAAAVNLRRLGPAHLTCWDARRLPLPAEQVDCVLCNPPFGKQLSSAGEIGPLYQAIVREQDRVLRPGGRALLLVSALPPLREAARSVGWQSLRGLSLRILGQKAHITVWRKPAR